jgi:hypothetical protein
MPKPIKHFYAVICKFYGLNKHTKNFYPELTDTVVPFILFIDLPIHSFIHSFLYGALYMKVHTLTS